MTGRSCRREVEDCCTFFGGASEKPASRGLLAGSPEEGTLLAWSGSCMGASCAAPGCTGQKALVGAAPRADLRPVGHFRAGSWRGSCVGLCCAGASSEGPESTARDRALTEQCAEASCGGPVPACLACSLGKRSAWAAFRSSCDAQGLLESYFFGACFLRTPLTLAPKRVLLGLLARTPQALHSRARVLWWRLQQAVSVAWHQVHSSGPCRQACWYQTPPILRST